MLVAAIAAALLAGAQAGDKAPAAPWTWSVYDRGDTVTLANEVPDTDALGAVFECVKGSGQAKVSVYPDGAVRPEDRFTVPLATRDPVFEEFRRTGRLVVRSEDRAATISVSPAHRGDLERFTRLCGR
jgi:hypothetical protein